MKTFTNEDLRKFDPCYDPIKYLKDDETNTILTILDHEKIPFEDKLWVILRNDYLSERIMRLFAVWCARQVQHLMTDKRSTDALDVAEAFANGLASKEELAAARDAASGAAWDAASGAAWDAASGAAWDAARDAARDAVLAPAWDVARDAARDAVRDAQKNKLREMIIAGIETGDVVMNPASNGESKLWVK